MATVKQYVTQMLSKQRDLALKLGTDIRRADKPTRVMNLSNLILASVVIKCLVDNGALTDQQLLATLQEAADDFWDDQPVGVDDDE